MEEETIEPEFVNIKKEHEIKINDDNKIKIEINNDEIKFTIKIGLSYHKYIKKFNFNEIKKILDIEYENGENIYDYLIKCEYKIIEEEKIIKINNVKEIKLEEKKLTNEEVIKTLIDEIKEIKDKHKKEINTLVNKYNELEDQLYIIDNSINKDKYKNNISLIYKTNYEGYYNIFGSKFVENNKNKIELYINGKKSDLVGRCKLKEGNNIITMKIKKKIKDLQYMFQDCSELENIDKLKYLDTKFCKDFSYMFDKCKLLSDIKALENWDVSNVKDFSHMFNYCNSLSDVKP